MADPLVLALASSAARSSSGDGGAFDALKPGRSVTADLSVTVASGAGAPLSVFVEQSETGVDGWEALATFAVARGTTKLTVSQGPALRYLRARWELAPGSSFTFSVEARAYSHLITRKQFINHIGPARAQLAFDDGNVGTPGEEPIDGVLAYVSSLLRGKLGPVDDLSGFTPETCSEIVRIGLDIGHARAAIRAPEVFRLDGQKMLDCAKKELKEIVDAKATIGATQPPATEAHPPANSYAAGVASFPRRERTIGDDCLPTNPDWLDGPL